MKTGTCLRPSWTAIVCPTISGKIVEVRDQVRIMVLLPDGASAAALLAAATAADHQLVRFLVLAARALAERRYVPRRDRVAAALRLALAAAVRVVDGIHRGAAHRRALPTPATAAGLAARDVLVVDVPDLTDCGPANERHAPHLAGREAQDGERAVLRDELDARAGRARHLRTLARLELDGMDERARRDVLERERVADADVRAGTRLDGRTDAQLGGREDVGLCAVRVVEQRDSRRPVRVVLDRRDLGRHAVLPALEVDDAVAALVTAALVARGDPAVRVAAAVLRERREQALLRLGLRDLLEGGDGHEATAGARRLVSANRHQRSPLVQVVRWGGENRAAQGRRERSQSKTAGATEDAAMRRFAA